jgi:nitrogen fixation NifU-like protein
MRYSKKVIDHFRNPRNAGELAGADGIGEVGNSICGDVMRFYVRIKNDKIIDIKFKTFGCGAAIAASSVMTQMAKGIKISDALKISNRDVSDALGGLPDSKRHCSLLAEETLNAAIEDYYRKHPQENR